MSRIHGFLRIPNRLLSCTGLSSNQKIVLSYIYGYAGNGKRCTVTRDVMSSHLGMNPRTLDNVIHSLYELHILGWEYPKSGATNRRVLFVRENDSEATQSWKRLYGISEAES
jgi:hypothetical protein